MLQICLSPSGQLAAAASAFRRARRKFPKNLGACACSGDADRYPPELHSVITKDGDKLVGTILLDSNKKTDRSFHSNPQRRGDLAYYQSLSSSRAASWSNNCRGDQRVQKPEVPRVIPKAEFLCATCVKQNSCTEATNYNSRAHEIQKDQVETLKLRDIEDNFKTSTSTSTRICTGFKAVESRQSNESRDEETAWESTRSSAGSKKRKHARRKRVCIHSESIRGSSSQSSPKIEGASQICLLHGFPDHNRKVSTVCESRNKEERETIWCRDLQTTADFPTKLQSRYHRSWKGPHAGKDSNPMSKRRENLSRQCQSHQYDCLSDRMNNSAGNQQGITHNSHSHKNDNSTPRLHQRSQEPSANGDICLRPSLIKAAQRKLASVIQEGHKNCHKYGGCGHKLNNSDLKPTWDENLSVINHKDSMSILMEKFRGNDKPHNLKLQNVYELNSVLGSKTSCGVEEEEPIRFGKNHRGTDSATNQSLLRNFDDVELESTENTFLPRRSSSGVNPVTKLGRVANQALRENENHIKNLESFINRSGICCSSKGAPWRRAL